MKQRIPKKVTLISDDYNFFIIRKLLPCLYVTKSSLATKLTCYQHQPVTPAEMKLQAPALEVYAERPLRQQAVVANGGADQEGSGKGLHVGTVTRNRN